MTPEERGNPTAKNVPCRDVFRGRKGVRPRELRKGDGRRGDWVGERSKGNGKAWKFHRRVRKVHLRTKCGVDRDTRVIGEAGKEGGRAR